jgi:hypothetical protein
LKTGPAAKDQKWPIGAIAPLINTCVAPDVVSSNSKDTCKAHGGLGVVAGAVS